MQKLRLLVLSEAGQLIFRTEQYLNRRVNQLVKVVNVLLEEDVKSEPIRTNHPD